MRPHPDSLLEQVFRLLCIRTMTAGELVKHFQRGAVRPSVQRLHQRGRIHVAEWRHGLIAAYRAGSLPDAARPKPRTSSQRVRKHRQKAAEPGVLRVASVFEFRAQIALAA